MNPNTCYAVLQAFAHWAWANSLAATVLIGLVCLAHLLGRKKLPPRWQYALWMLVVLRLLLPVVPATTFSIFNLGRSFKPEPAILPPSLLSPTPSEVLKPTSVPQRATATHPIKGSSSAFGPNVSPRTLIAVVPYVWLAGALAYFLAIFLQHRRLAAWIRRQEPVNDSSTLLQEARTLFRVRREIQVVAAASLSTPALFGFLKPRLLIPKSLLQQPQELRLVLLHELAHLKRGDVLQNWLLISVQALHWFNPAVWLALKRLRADRELVCDAMVLARLNAQDQHAYGAALLKLVEQFSKPLPVPTLVLVINYKPQIHRRITMIAHFKPTPRVITVAAALLALGLAGVTFTGAAEKDRPRNSDKQSRDASPRPDSADAGRRQDVYEKELAKLDDQIRDAQKQADRLKEELGVALESVKADFPEMLRDLERERIVAQSEYQQFQSLYTQLAGLSRPELLKLLPTASPDPLLLELYKRKQTADQDLAEASETYGQGHTEVTRKVRLVKIIDQQINERVDGILKGLKIKMESYKQKVDSLKAELDKVKKNDIELAIKSRPYFQKKRDLETLQAMRERLQFRIIQDKVDAALPRSTEDKSKDKLQW